MRVPHTGNFLLLMLASIFLVSGCHKAEDGITVEGTVGVCDYAKQMYGTHILEGSCTTFALESDKIDLDHYVDMRVVVIGLIKESREECQGPPLIEVYSILCK
jgi:hypothetical protein